MKKLIISMVATASIALVAKADVAPLNATSFEDYSDFSVDKTEAGEYYWSGGGTAGNEGVFEIKALGEGGLSTKGDVARPKYWDGKTPDGKALSIDTDVALSRHVNAERTAQGIDTALYFDSMVQFTATDTAPTPTPTSDDVIGDKLIVWMREVVAGNETTYALYVTAGVPHQGTVQTKHYELTNVAGIAPDSWHRLTIAISKTETGETPTFKVYVDGVVAQSTKIYNPDGEVQTLEQAVEEFGSLTSAEETNSGTLTSVSFQGKGAIDDLVWTTEDPNAPDTIPYSVIVDDTVGSGVVQAKYKYGAGDEVEVALYEGDKDETADFALAVPVDATSVTFIFPDIVATGDYEIKDGAFVDGVATITIPLPVEGAQINLKVIEKVVVAKPFTVTIGENEEQFETLAGAIAAAKGATIKLTQAATLMETLTVAEAAVIDLNGQTLTLAKVEDNYAVVVKAALTITDSSSEKSGTVVVLGEYGFGMTAGSLTINAGNFVATDTDYLIGAWAGTVAISGGNFTAGYCVVNLFKAVATAEISGGMFTVVDEVEVIDGVEYAPEVILSEVGGSVAVSGGLFSTQLTEALCAEGYIPTTEAVEGYYTVVRGYAVTVEAANATVTGLASKYAAGATVSFTVTADEGYEVKSVAAEDDKATVSEANGVYSFTMPAEAVKIVVTTEAVNNEPVYPEITPEDEDEDVKDFSDAVKAVIEAAFTPQGGTYNPPAALTVISNGVELKGNKAVDMIEEIVKKFEGNPFTADGKLELTFKVTDVMKALTGLKEGYELSVGSATLKDNYEVVPRWYDIDKKEWDVDAPQDGATKGFFKLKIQKKAN